MTPEQEIRYLIIKAIEDCEPIFDAEYQAVVHMKLLKYIGWTVDEIYEKYDFFSRRKFDFIYKHTSIQLVDFNSERYLGISADDFEKFLGA